MLIFVIYFDIRQHIISFLINDFRTSIYEKNVGNSLGLCPDWDSWDQTKPVDNAREAMQQADEWLGVPQVINFSIV